MKNLIAKIVLFTFFIPIFATTTVGQTAEKLDTIGIIYIVMASDGRVNVEAKHRVSLEELCYYVADFFYQTTCPSEAVGAEIKPSGESKKLMGIIKM